MAKHISNGKCEKCSSMLFEVLCNPILHKWFEDLQKENPEVHLACVYRGKEEQDKYFREGKSKAKFGSSPHNYIPVMAVDIFILKDGKYSLDIGAIKNIADSAPDDIEWGGSWKSFKDVPHFEIKNWKLLVDGFPKGNKK